MECIVANHNRVPSLLSLCCSAKDSESMILALPLSYRADPVIMSLMPIVALVKIIKMLGSSLGDSSLDPVWRQRLKTEFGIVPSSDRSAASIYFEAFTSSSITECDPIRVLLLGAILPIPVYRVCLQGFHPPNLSAAKQILPTLQTLTHLEFRLIRKVHMPLMCDILCSICVIPSLDSLSLSDFLLGDFATSNLIRCIPRHISSLSISNTNLGDNCLSALAYHVMRQLKSLVVKESGLESFPLHNFFLSLPMAEQLESLVLDPAPNCPISLPPRLVSLSLDFEESNAVLLPSLAAMAELRQLRLASLPAWQFRLPSNLSHLTLYECKLTAQNIQSVLSGLSPKTLFSLDLSQNSLTADSSLILESLLTCSLRSLCRLSLSGCKFVPTSGFMDVVAASCITDLNLSLNNLSDATSSLLTLFVRQLNRCFHRLDLSSNRIKDLALDGLSAATGSIDIIDLRWNLLPNDKFPLELKTIASDVSFLPQALNLVCDAIQCTSWADSMIYGT